MPDSALGGLSGLMSEVIATQC